MRRLVAGCMTGTSMDALDAALVEVSGRGFSMSARFVRGVSLPLGDVAQPLRRLAAQERLSAAEIVRTGLDFARLHTEAIQSLMDGSTPDLICIHGQTVFHVPPLSWQFLQPVSIVRAIGAPVVFDLRAADLAAGGQGAPITPLADWVFFRRAAALGPRGSSLAVVNLGGFVNFTLLPGGGGGAGAAEADQEIARITGGDVCACNQVLDAVARALLGTPFDEGGKRAAAGTVHERALADLLAVLARQSCAGRSLGTGDEAAGWIERWKSEVEPGDVAATACEGIARTVSERLRADGERQVVLAGGGIRNLALRGALERMCSGMVRTTDDLGLPSEYREAACMAVLGALSQDRVPITLPAVTGVPAPAPVAGCWMYP